MNVSSYHSLKDCMQTKYLLLAALVLTAALSTFYLTPRSASELSSDSELDLTCGFTDDFNKFIKVNGTTSYS